MIHPKLDHICTLTVELADIIEMGQGRGGQRRIIPIIGGTATGAHLNGKILNLGADWQTVFDGGLAQLDTRYAMQTDDGAVIEIINFGLRHGPAAVMARVAAGEAVDPSEYYMRTHARLETGDARYEWVNRTLSVGTGQRLKRAVSIDLFALR